MSKKSFVISPKPQQGPGKAVDETAWVSGAKPQAGERTKRFTFDVPESLHRRVKAQCALKGIDMAEEMRHILEQHFPEKP
jgi:hypothetical protein